jgi:acyl-coenzyme A synthetase/AMP-(fatty) acid ligase
MYTYRTLTEAEIDQYIAFAESDEGKRYHRITYTAVHDAVTRSARKLGARLGIKMEKV